MSKLEKHCNVIKELFEILMQTPGRNDKQTIIDGFRKIAPKEILDDLDYCFEILAGKHKLGYTYTLYKVPDSPYTDLSIKELIEKLKTLPSSDDGKYAACSITPESCRVFIMMLVNRSYKIGFSNKEQMITNLSPMLAKKYPESHHESDYFIQEKLDGNRCIAYFDYDNNVWKFQSRSGKPLNVNFDMSWVKMDTQNEYPIFDGEIMTLGHAGSRDFNRTSGMINSKYIDKSQLHYYIYDIIDDTLVYNDRYNKLLEYYNQSGEQCSILPILDRITVYKNPQYNWKLDQWLDEITSKGGEGLILRDPYAVYQHKRTDALLKYKKVQTMDLRIIGWNEGSGKYAGMIGSFICENDEHTILVNVAGMNDDIRASDPSIWIGTIIEVAYFDHSASKNNDKISLRFPRLKRIRLDKNETSIY